MTSGDMMVREGTNITLTCRAKGFPDPYVMWRREDSNEMYVHGENGNFFFLIFALIIIFFIKILIMYS